MKPNTTTSPVNMTREYRAELRQIVAQKKRLTRDFRNRCLSEGRAIAKLIRDQDKELAAMKRAGNRDEKSTQRQIDALEKRRLILEGRLSK